MIELFCRNRVADYSKWKAVFDSNTQACRAAGLRLTGLWRDVEDDNNVFFVFDVENIENARAFINDPASVEAGKTSGVLDGEYHFMERCLGD